MKTISFATAVLTVITEFRNSNIGFSAWDITKTLRARANSGMLFFSDLEPANIDGVDTYRLDHQTVSFFIQELWNENILRNMGLDRSIKNDGSNNSYYFYTAAGASNPYSNLNQSTKICPTSNLDSYRSIIKEYLGNKYNKGEYPTLKSIQSRLKRVVRTSVKDIEKFVRDEGYDVVQTPGLKYSLSMVK